MLPSAKEIIDRLELLPHPEGGYYREIYRSTGIIPHEALGKNYTGARHYATSIYFLLTGGSFSSFHRIQQDEMWHFYLGDPLTIHILENEGSYLQKRVEPELSDAGAPFQIVKAGDWFAAATDNPQGYSLVGCTVAPGFHFDDFELGSASQLIARYPQFHELIKQYTRLP